MQTARTFPLARGQEPGTIWIPVRNSLHIVAEAEGVGITKVSLHMLGEHVNLLDRYAAVENALVALRRVLAKARGEKVFESKVKWTRKELAEVFLKAQCEDLAERLAEQTKAVGALPDPDDAKAVAGYAERLHAWLNKKQNRG